MNKSSRDQLLTYAKKADTKKMEDLLQIGKAVRGMTTFNLGEIISYIQQDHDQARSMVALAAVGYFESGKSTNYLFGIYLSLLATLYLGAFQSDAKYAKDCKNFFILIEDCVPNIYDLIGKFGKEFNKQVK